MSAVVSTMGPVKKPGHGEPCNGCGVCCRATRCPLAQAFFDLPEPGPCPALEEVGGGRSTCGLVVHPMVYAMKQTLLMGAARMSAAAMTLTGAGLGCDALIPGDVESKEFRVRLRQAYRERRGRVNAALKTWGVYEVVKQWREP